MYHRENAGGRTSGVESMVEFAAVTFIRHPIHVNSPHVRGKYFAGRPDAVTQPVRIVAVQER